MPIKFSHREGSKGERGWKRERDSLPIVTVSGKEEKL